MKRPVDPGPNRRHDISGGEETMVDIPRDERSVSDADFFGALDRKRRGLGKVFRAFDSGDVDGSCDMEVQVLKMGSPPTNPHR